MHSNQNQSGGTPNIEKIVPVKKNGFIFELQVPPPNSGMSINNANQNINQQSAQASQIQQQMIQNQQTTNMPVQQQAYNQQVAPQQNISQNNFQNPNNLPQNPQAEQQAAAESNNPLSFRKLFGG